MSSIRKKILDKLLPIFLINIINGLYLYFAKFNIDNTCKRRYMSAGHHVFFGYNDRSPLSKLGDLVLAHRTMDTKWDIDSPKFPIEVGYFHYDDGKSFNRIFESKAWSLQQGSMLQFLPNSVNSVMFNDFCDDLYITRVCSLNGDSIIDLPFSFYSISSDLSYITSIDFERLSFFRPGYGYNCNGYRNLSLNDPVAYKVFNFADCSIYKEVLYEELGISPVLIHCFYVNHLVFSEDNKYLAFFLVYQNQSVRKITVVIQDLINHIFHKVNKEGLPSHFCWMGASGLVLTIRNEKLEWSTNLYRILENEKVINETVLKGLNFDSHPACIKHGELIVDTAHLSMFGQTKLYKFSLESSDLVLIKKFWLPNKFRGILRSDLHHRLVRNKEELHLDVVVDGLRCCQIITLNDASYIY